MEGQKPGRGGSQGRIARHERSAAQRALILDGSPSGGYGGQNQLQKGALLYCVPLLSPDLAELLKFSDLCLANCYLAHHSSGFPALRRFCDVAILSC